MEENQLIQGGTGPNYFAKLFISNAKVGVRIGKHKILGILSI